MPVVREQIHGTMAEEAYRVSLEPAQALFSDLILLDKLDERPGADPWVERTAQAMGDARRERHHAILNGLYYALRPVVSYPDFPTYIESLRSQHPSTWIDRLFDAYEQECKKLGAEKRDLETPNREELLADFDLYLKYLSDRFDAKYIFEDVERQAHRWLNDPQKMQTEVVEHLQWMWSEHLEPGWQVSLPLLQDCVRAFRQVSWPAGTPLEVAQWVIGQEVEERQQRELAEADRVVFAPSTHVGPYVISIQHEGVLWITFGARVPEGARVHSPALSRSQLLVKLGAMADENRLHILDLLRDEDELCAQEIIERLGLSQSSASRHLRQLTASGFLLERRRESAKCYRLHTEQCGETVTALESFLGVDRR